MAWVEIFIIWSVLHLNTLVVSTEMQALDVTKYGAVGDGVTDDSQAFSRAWNDVCGAKSGITTLEVPPRKVFMLKPIRFEGPCKTNNVRFQIQGKIVAPEKVWGGQEQDNWIVFSDIDGLNVSGDGTIDGQGAAWWKYCPMMKSCRRPTALRITNSKNVNIVGLTHINSQRNHISIDACNYASIRDLHIQAPESSPNTDGIDIASSTNIVVDNLTIATGDDCIAINNASFFINITSVKCGPGHGISIGSLGKNGEYDVVENIYVKNCTFNGTTNGARIKTWKGGSGYARKIQFEDITFYNTENPVFIDQSYCPHGACKIKVERSDVDISEVTYNNLLGTSKSPNAITFNCSSLHGCTGIKMNDVHISPINKGENVYSICNNAQGHYNDTSPPMKCGKLLTRR